MERERNISVLVVDDEELLKQSLVDLLVQERYVAVGAGNAEEAIDILAQRHFHVVLTDVTMPGRSGLELLKHIREQYPDTRVIVMTAFGSMSMAIDLIKRGAYYYLAKPIQHDELLLLIERAVEEVDRDNEIGYLKGERARLVKEKKLIYQSGVMETIFQNILKLSAVDAPVLITGENGTGKDITARLLHDRGPRAGKRFVALNCAAIPENLVESEIFGHEKGSFTGAVAQKKGLAEVADGGTLFLDEIGELSLPLQAKLLRFIEEKKFRRVGGTRNISVDIRILSATNRDLREAVAEKIFRQDLYFRLRVLHVHLPALRDRVEDIPLLVEHFLSEFTKRKNVRAERIAPSAMVALRQYNWPGNIRELKNIIEQAVLLSEHEEIQTDDLAIPRAQPGGIQREHGTDFSPYKDAKAAIIEGFEKEYFRELLKKTSGHMTRAAEMAGMDRKNLSVKLSRYDIRKEDYKP